MRRAADSRWVRLSSSPLRWNIRIGHPGFYGAALLALFLAYVVILALTSDTAPDKLLLHALANALPVALLGLGVRALLRRLVLERRTIAQAAAHLALALVFTILWFWLLMVLLGAIAGQNAVQFNVRPFLGPAAAWQLFQGVTIYALVAVLVHVEALLDTDAFASNAIAEEQPSSRLFVRRDEEIHPLDPERIILIRGADDYAQVITATGSHLVRMTLSALAERLGERFIRVHRSCLVNVNHIAKAEPAGGGRMLLHMENGEMIQASRAGTRLLRERVI